MLLRPQMARTFVDGIHAYLARVITSGVYKGMHVCYHCPYAGKLRLCKFAEPSSYLKSELPIACFSPVTAT